jgi:hypothetical protein
MPRNGAGYRLIVSLYKTRLLTYAPNWRSISVVGPLGRCAVGRLGRWAVNMSFEVKK